MSRLGSYKLTPPVLTKARSHEGEPCKRGWTAARTGCEPAGKKPAAKVEKPQVEDIEKDIETLKGGKIEAKDVNDLAKKLSGLTVAQLTDLKKKLGLKASGAKVELAKKIAERALEKEKESGKRGDRSERVGEPAEKLGERVAKPSKRPDVSRAGGDRSGKDKPARERASKRISHNIETVNKKLDRFSKLFRDRGQPKVADWMEKVRAHVNEVGVEEAMSSLGVEEAAEDRKKVQYEGAWFEDGGAASMGDWATKYLSRYGITLLPPGVAPGRTAVVSSIAPSQGQVPIDEYLKGDFRPKDPTFKDKLEEAKHLPGLTMSEDINKLLGRPVTHLDADVIAKLDEVYGEGQWIVKAYGDEAASGFGVFFPQRAAKIQQDAKSAIFAANSELGKYGFKLNRDTTGKVNGIVHESGTVYDFSTEEYDKAVFGEARYWADIAGTFADNEKGALLPIGGKEFMAQPAFPVVGISDEDRAAGMLIKSGQEGRVHIVTRNGKAEIVPHSTWLKHEDLPVVFENDDTQAMAQAAVNAINALPESERKGQIYAPDIVKTAQGYKVVEANPANKTGTSGYLGDNPMIIDAYTSFLTGRSPAHVTFLRDLLGRRKKGKGKSLGIKSYFGNKILVPPQLKSLSYFTKDKGGPCKQGETAARSGCVPASGEGAKKEGKEPTAEREEISEVRRALSAGDAAALRQVGTKVKQAAGKRDSLGVAGLQSIGKILGVTGKFKKVGLAQAIQDKIGVTVRDMVSRSVSDRLDRIKLAESPICSETNPPPCGTGMKFKDRLVNAAIAASFNARDESYRKQYREAMQNVSLHGVAGEGVGTLKVMRDDMLREIKDGRNPAIVQQVLQNLSEAGYGTIKPEELNDFLEDKLKPEPMETGLIPEEIRLKPEKAPRKKPVPKKPANYVDRLREPVSDRLLQLQEREKQSGVKFASLLVNQVIANPAIDEGTLPGKARYQELAAKILDPDQVLTGSDKASMRDFRKLVMSRIKREAITPVQVAEGLENLDREGKGTLSQMEFETILKKINSDVEDY